MAVLTEEQTLIKDQASSTSLPQPINLDFGQRMANMEKNLVTDALKENGHNQRRTAEALGLSYDQLRGLVRKYTLSNRKRTN